MLQDVQQLVSGAVASPAMECTTGAGIFPSAYEPEEEPANVTTVSSSTQAPEGSKDTSAAAGTCACGAGMCGIRASLANEVRLVDLPRESPIYRSRFTGIQCHAVNNSGVHAARGAALYVAVETNRGVYKRRFFAMHPVVLRKQTQKLLIRPVELRGLLVELNNTC